MILERWEAEMKVESNPQRPAGFQAGHVTRFSLEVAFKFWIIVGEDVEGEGDDDEAGEQ
jgi:hypothetical protein